MLNQTLAAAVQAMPFDKILPSGLLMVRFSTQKPFLDVNEGQCHYKRIAGKHESGSMNAGQLNKTGGKMGTIAKWGFSFYKI